MSNPKKTKKVYIVLTYTGTILSKIIKYYNIFEGSVLNKETNLYKINNLDETITFSKLMYKISDNKYLIAYPNIVIMFSDDQTAEMKDYVEIEYVSKDVIRIDNE